MKLVNMWEMDIVGPAILLILLIWLVIRAGSSSNSDNEPTEHLNRDKGSDEELRRRGGTDGF